MTPREKWKLVPLVIGSIAWVAVAAFVHQRFFDGAWDSNSLAISIGVGSMVGPPWIMIFGRKLVDIVFSLLSKLEAPNPNLAPAPTSYQPDAALQATFDELETLRRQTRNRFRARVAQTTLIGALTSLVFLGVPSLFYGDKIVPEMAAGTSLETVSTVFYLLFLAAIGAFVGRLWSGVGFTDDKPYQQYRQRVLSKIAASFGQLNWRPAQTGVLGDLSRYQLFSWTESETTDEIYGTYRGMPLSIIDLYLIDDRQFQTVSTGVPEPRRQIEGGKVVFNGIVITLTLPRNLRSATVIVPNTLSGCSPEGLQPVHLEDPQFAKKFKVFASDQVLSRTLLTPAFMMRFIDHLVPAYGAPRVLAKDQQFIIAVTTNQGNFFDLPTYRAQGAMRNTLIQLHQRIATYLRVADAVIDLDQSARQQAAVSATPAP